MKGPGSISTGRIAAVAVSPVDPDIVLAGASSGGIWRSVDGRASFQPVSDDQIDLTVGSIAFAPSNPRVVLLQSFLRLRIDELRPDSVAFVARPSAPSL